MANWKETLDGQQLLEQIANQYKTRMKAEADLLSLQLSNAEKLYAAEISQINKKQAYQVQQQQIINTKLISMGYSANQILAKDELAEKLKVIKAEYATRIKEAKGAQKKILKDEMDAAVKAAKSKVDTLINEILDKSEELDKKQKKKQSQQLIGGSQGNLSQTLSTSPFNIQELKQALDDLSDDLRETLGEEAGLGKGDKAKLMLASAATALANYTKQLASQIKEIAYAQSEIDTRLQGSNLNKTYFGSYWKQMNQDIIRYVGMSPLIKQSDVVNSLKTLVGKGIAFNVEQRAFLDTVSEKIANTFEATDATLLKLVRIQQADTTAARLGMESALTAFLNNMYETTEYMTEAAASIRSSLYEASALMGAAEATAFEYQVQKWMGSLYSVGFSNTEGLAGALGKLAAGDISAINNGGYGNLLIMAANRAGISIADILAKGLDDSETNKLLQAVVEYLGDIYAETRNSKVVAQQFANIYGLTASDLKAAANLFGSTNTIGRNTMGYTGMITQLQKMAGSMYSRMGTGEMLENLFDNFKNSIATSMGNNPVLYTIFTLGNMLKDTTGGIDIPLPLYMGTGLNAKLNVADLMLATSLAGGFLEGMGTMISGLFTGNGVGSGAMLKNFGIYDNRLTTLTRGTGTGVAAISGATVSESGTMVGNANASDVQNQTIGSAEEEGNEKVEAAAEESDETKLSTVDEHILQIYDLLQGVVDGTSSFHVDMGNASAWADVIGGGGI